MLTVVKNLISQKYKVKNDNNMYRSIDNRSFNKNVIDFMNTFMKP